MYIVVSNTNQMPQDVPSNNLEHWTLSEFVEKGNSDEGIDIDEGIYFNVACLNEDIYALLVEYASYNIKIVYYRYEDTPDVSFPMMDDVVVYKEVKEEPKVEEKVEETPQQAPKVEEMPQNPPTQEPFVPNMEMGTSVLTSMDNPANMGYQPQQQPMSQQNPPQYQQVEQNPFQQVEQPHQYQQSNQQPMSSGSGQLYGSQSPYSQPYSQPQPNIPNESYQMEEHQEIKVADDIRVASGSSNANMNSDIFKKNVEVLLQKDAEDNTNNRDKNRKAGKVILFGSSKGGTGKTFTCLATAYWYAKTHPQESIALADFDIIDGQIGITLNKITPTMQNYYGFFKQGMDDIDRLKMVKVKSEYFSPNIDFYLAPAQDIPEITNNTQFWTNVFKLLITNYDVVFFDSGIDYLGKAPISQLYKIADKIIITCNPSINSVKSVIKQFNTLSGKRANNVYSANEEILKRVNVVLTRVYESGEINEIVVSNLVKHAPVIAAFGNIDNIISRIQWYQEWRLIDTNPEITQSLNEIASI